MSVLRQAHMWLVTVMSLCLQLIRCPGFLAKGDMGPMVSVHGLLSGSLVSLRLATHVISLTQNELHKSKIVHLVTQYHFLSHVCSKGAGADFKS